MSTNNWGRLGIVSLVIAAFFLGDTFPFDPSLYAVIAALASSVAWALSATFDEAEVAAGPNLTAALLAALATGFYTQSPAPG